MFKRSFTPWSKRLLSLSLALTPVIAAGCEEAPEVVRTRVVSREIMGGVNDTTSRNVVGLFSLQGSICSGSLIAPNVVLTAQHCIAEVPTSYVICGVTRFGDVYQARSFYATTDATLSRSAQYFPVEEIVVPEGSRNQMCGNDIALLILRNPIPDSIVTPMVPRIDLPIETGEKYTAVGYGHTGDGNGAGVRRRREDRTVLCAGSTCPRNAQVEPNEFVGTEGTCQGDSGGPAIDTAGRVIGVLSRGPDGCRASTYASVPNWKDLIIETVKRAADQGGYDVPMWAELGSTTERDDDLDLVADSLDNCPGVANPDQADIDGDGIGDACDPTDNRDRGGDCKVCNGCSTDADCGDGGLCRNIAGENVCTRACQSGADCQGNTGCFGLGEEQLCVNLDAGDNGICPADFVCDTAAGVEDDECAICRTCNSDADCGPDGRCEDFGSGKVCTLACGADDSCPGDARCFGIPGADGQREKLCLNPDAGSGLCASDWVCTVTPVEIPEPGDGSGDGSGEEEPVRVKPRAKGCSAAPTDTTDPAIALGLLALGLLVGRRRRD